MLPRQSRVEAREPVPDAEGPDVGDCQRLGFNGCAFDLERRIEQDVAVAKHEAAARDI